MIYGYCPICAGEGVYRERSPDGNTRCKNGHSYPSKSAFYTAEQARSHIKQSAQAMTPDKCQVCGCAEPSSTGKGYKCGGETSWSDCDKASDLAIERAAEIERLKASHARLIALFRRMSVLPGDYNLIQDAEFVFRDLRDALASETLTETKPQEK